MIIKNCNEHNPICIEFNLSLWEERYIENEDFCLYISINITHDGQAEEYKDIVIDRNSIEIMIEDVRKFINKEKDEIYYEPLEEDFWLHIPKNYPTKEEYRNQLIENGFVDEEHLQEALEDIDDTIHWLFFLVDICKYKKGFSTGTGIAYRLLVSDSQLEQFISQFEQKYTSLFEAFNTHNQIS